MLILVAVTITIAVNGGLFEHAGEASNDTKLAMQNELKISEGGLVVDGKKYNSPQDYIDGVESGLPPKYSASLLDENGVLTKNATYTDKNNAKVEIPKGFKVSNDSLENTKAGGLVIKDKDGNEFVWIPVEFEGTATDENGFYPEFLAVFYRTSWSNNERTTGLATIYKEPYTSGYPNESAEYNSMMKSVQEHKGFYIGRYEAGSTTPRNENSAVTTPIIKQDVYPYTYVKWGESMSDIGETGAVALSKSMYNDSTKYGVVSTLCYGVQWDAMLDFVKDENHIVNGITWGNFKKNTGATWEITRQTAKYSEDYGTTWKQISDEPEQKKEKTTSKAILLTTGANDNFKSKNLYDVAGNLYEWTMEAYSNYNRINRSGGYAATDFYASSRNNSSPTSATGGCGFRPTLYLINTES